MTSTACLPILPLLVLTLLPQPAVSETCPTASSGCCLPDQFQVVLTELVKINQPVHKITKLAIDYKAEKLVSIDYYRNTSAKPFNDTFIQRRLLDYRAGVEVSYYTNSSGSCTSRPDTIKPFQCVPDNADYLGDHYMGFNVGGMAAYFYRFKFNGSSNVITIAFQRQSLLGSRKGVCVPLVQVITNGTNLTDGRPTVLTEFEPCLNHDFNMTAGC